MLEHPRIVDMILTTRERAVVGRDGGAHQKISKRRAGNGSRWSGTRKEGRERIGNGCGVTLQCTVEIRTED